MSNEELARKVGDELTWDPRVDSTSIAVDAEDGHIKLRGTVGSLWEKGQAKKAAERVYGVVSVQNDLDVRLMTHDARSDADLRGDVLSALLLDTIIPATVDAKVDDGVVTLTGTAEQQFQRDEAMHVASNVRGVIDARDDIELVGPPPTAGNVDEAIRQAFVRSAKLDAKSLSVETAEHTVTLKGTVKSWAEHDEAIAAAWAAPGVRDVNDRILVLY
jgi:osmotically-inducible protein OsmY